MAGSSDAPSLSTVAGIAAFDTNSTVELTLGGYLASPYGFWLQVKDNQSSGNGSGAAYPLLLNPIGGNVGIGVTNPGTKLDINGKTRFRDDAGMDAGRTLYFGQEENFGGAGYGGNDYGYITFINDDNDYNFWGDSGENSSFILGNQNDSLGNNVADVMVLKGAQANIFDSLSGLNLFVSANSAGRDPKVGIGTTSPSKRLVVHGSDALINDLTVGRGGTGDSTNSALGSFANSTVTSGVNNTAVGFYAHRQGNGSDNTAVGCLSMDNNTASGNTAVGMQSLYNVTSGPYNTAVGYKSLYSAGASNYSTAVGAEAGYGGSSAGRTAIGYQALAAAAAAYSTAVGYRSLNGNTTGTNNVGLGAYTLEANDTGANNTAIGANALAKLSKYDRNTAIGANAMANSTQGSDNVALGHYALYSTSTDVANVALGSFSLQACNSSYNVGIGYSSLYSVTTGGFNVAIGPLAGTSITTGANNVVVGGYGAGGAFATQSNNIFISDGSGNLRMIITGSNGNVGIGTTNPGFKLDVNGTINGTNINKTYSLPDVGGSASWMKLGTFTAAQGGKHLYIKVVTSNGYNANPAQMSEVEIHFKTSNGSSTDANGFAGDATFYITNGSTSPGHNVKIKGNASGTSATAFEIWFYQGGAYNGTSLYTVEIPGDASGLSWSHAGTTGSDPGAASSTVHVASQRFVIQSSVGIGVTTPSTKLHVDGTIRNSNMPGTGLNYYIGINGNNDIVYIVSSRKYKKNIQNYTVGLDKIKLMNPVTYQEKLDVEQKTQVGLIAEELHDVGLTEYVFYNKNGDPDAVDYPRITAILTNGIKELKTENDALKTEIQSLKDQISSILAMLSNK
jgi:hypothetical protein